MSINSNLYRSLLQSRDIEDGGQELIAFEIVAAMRAAPAVFLPLSGSAALLACLEQASWVQHISLNMPKQPYAVYFGTPTIVNNRPLFTGGAEWTKSYERRYVASLCEMCAQDSNCIAIISGLGSGDISVDERLLDMGGGQVVCMKTFDSFTDWVLARYL